MSNDNGPRRGWLGDLTGGILPDDGLYIRREPFLAGNKDGATLGKLTAARFTHQKVVGNYGKMISSPSGRWLRWRLHEVRSKVLYCHCHPSQPCHCDVLVRALAEAMLEEKQRGGAPLCEAGWALKSHLCLSPRSRGFAMQEMLKGCSTLPTCPPGRLARRAID